MTKEVLTLALEALEGLFGTAEQFEGGGVAVWRLGGSHQPKQAIAALRLAIDVQNMASESTYKEALSEDRVEQSEQSEPFGYFKAEPFGWTDCAETDEGAIALYEVPQRTWAGLMRGVRVEGDTVVITVKNGNDAARELCGALIEEMNT